MASGASAADVRSILSLPAAGPSAGPSQRPTPQAALPGAKQRRTKPEGISRELYALIGSSAPSLSVQLAKPKFKQKPNLGGAGKAVKWEWREFRNGARSDSLKLGHWTKASSDPDAEYAFAKYNVKSQALNYSQDEYSRLLEDPAWTKEETDYLFEIVKIYDLRFFVIADRYDYPGGSPRSLEDIKDRYYSVARRLIRNRPWPGDEASKNQILTGLQYDKEREVTRKKYIVSLENRTPEQIAEEEALYVEIKRLESNERRFTRERDELLRTLAGVESGLASVAISTSADEEQFAGALGGDGKGQKKRRATELESPVSAGPGMISIGAPPAPTRKVQSAKSAAHDALHCIHRTDTGSSQVTKAAHQPVYLRSFKMASPKAGLAPKVTQTLGELGINHTRMVMPTRENLQLLESLIDATSSLVETKKVVDKIDAEILILRQQLKERQANGGEDKGENMDEDRKTEDADGEADADADAEAAEDKGDGDRATSVATSNRSVGRKRLKRSMSISSVDTTGTTATRTGRKRQKA